MKKNRKTIAYLRLFRPFLHFLLIMLGFYLIFRMRFHTDLIPFIQLKIPQMDFIETMIFAVFASLVFILMGFINGIYELFKPIHGYYRKFLKSYFIGIIAVAFIAYIGFGFIFVNGISRFVLFIGSILAILLISFFDVFFNMINSGFEHQNPYKILFLYSNKKFFEKILKNFEHYRIYTVEGKDVKSLPEKFGNTIKNYDIVVSLGNLDKDMLQKIADYSRIGEKSFYNISESYFLDDLIYEPGRLGPILAFEYKSSPLDGWFRVLKRFFDIVFSILFLLLFWWVYMIIALAIYIEDGGPVIYVSKRVGKGQKLIKFLKFRSMIKDAEDLLPKLLEKNERKGPLFKIKDDPRVTKVGKFIRKTSLDELPQMWNVLTGDMSLVGPRPHLPEEVEKYKGWHKRLFSIKPGITGYAQVFGRDKLDFDEEAKLDLYYIQNWSLFLDIYVIISTMKVALKGN